MNNSDMPAHANEIQLDDAVSLGCESTVKGLAEFHSGLSKREYFAGLAMQGFCAAPDTCDWSTETLAKCAAGQAGALLAELEKTK